MAYFSDIRIGGSTFSNRVSAMQSNLVERFTKYRMYRNTLTELRSLSTRELDDLGLNQDKLRSVALEAAYK